MADGSIPYRLNATVDLGGRIFGPGPMVALDRSYQTTFHRGRRTLLPGESFLLPVPCGKRLVVAAQMRGNGRGLVVPMQATTRPIPVGGTKPGSLVTFKEEVFTPPKIATHQGPFYKDGCWVSIDPVGAPNYWWMTASMLDKYLSQVSGKNPLWHTNGNVLTTRMGVPAHGWPWKNLYHRMVWGGTNTKDLSLLPFMLAVVPTIVTAPPAALTKGAKQARLSFTSYPHSAAHDDDNPSISSSHGALDTAWDPTLGFDQQLPGSTLKFNCYAFEGLDKGYPNNDFRPPDNDTGAMESYRNLIFPFARGSHQDARDQNDSRSLNYPLGAADCLTDLSKITAMQLDIAFEPSIAGDSGADNTLVTIGGFYLDWNTYDGAYIDPFFFTDAFYHALPTAGALGFLNIGDHEDELSYLVADAYWHKVP